MYLKLTNNLTKVEYTFTGLTDNLESRMFYSFTITLPEGISDGEYKYELFDEENTLQASGLLQVGDYVPEKTEYKPENKQDYITYNG